MLSTANTRVPFDVVVTVCGSAHDSCPNMLGARTVHVGFDDPPRHAQGAKSDRLFFVEENTLGNGRRGDVAFVDTKAWLNSDGTSRNELGDSNTIVQYDPHWCGHLFGTNVLKKYGFMEAYARYGRGLIIYNGFDLKEDQGRDIHQLITRELAQPFDPDGLPCSVQLGDFIITSEPRLLTQTLVPGNTYTYPLSLLSIQGYQGRVTLAATVNPSNSALGFNLQAIKMI